MWGNLLGSDVFFGITLAVIIISYLGYISYIVYKAFTYLDKMEANGMFGSSGINRYTMTATKINAIQSTTRN